MVWSITKIIVPHAHHDNTSPHVRLYPITYELYVSLLELFIIIDSFLCGRKNVENDLVSITDFDSFHCYEVQTKIKFKILFEEIECLVM